jgi:hypothetical protein
VIGVLESIGCVARLSKCRDFLKGFHDLRLVLTKNSAGQFDRTAMQNNPAHFSKTESLVWSICLRECSVYVRLACGGGRLLLAWLPEFPTQWIALQIHLAGSGGHGNSKQSDTSRSLAVEDQAEAEISAAEVPVWGPLAGLGMAARFEI